MAVLPIYNSFHPILKNKASKVEAIDDSVRQLVDDMFETLYNISNGVGLAANQVGDKRAVIIIDLGVGEDEEEKLSEKIVMINPEIIDSSENTDDDYEGCLSVPEYFEKVVRPAQIKVKYYDLDMQEIVRDVDGFLARCMQHEIDHLNGVLFYERLSGLRKTLGQNKLKKIKKGNIVPDYPMINADGKPQKQ
jgi:peptide deformylase